VQASAADLLGDLGAPPAAAPVVPAAQAGNLLDLDLLGGPQPQALGAVSGLSGGLAGLNMLGTSPTQPGQLQPTFSPLGGAGGMSGTTGHGAAFLPTPGVGGGKPMAAAGQKGPGPGASNTPTDPFKDLLA
jgi:hypothetical protein